MTGTDGPIERLAAETLLHHGLAPCPPIDVELLAERMGVGAILRRRMVEDGRLEHQPHAMTRILVNETASATRQRFTIAHELAHLLLAAPDAPVTARRSRPRYGDEERFCDDFAGALLLPADWLRAAAGGQPPGLGLVRRLAKACSCSLAAVVLRCNQLLGWSYALLQWRMTHGDWRLVAVAGGSLHDKVRSAPQTAAILPHLLHRGMPVTATLPLVVGDRLVPVAAEVAGSGTSAVALVDVRKLGL